jgi:hypothetical protein
MGLAHANYITREGKYGTGEKAEELTYKEHGNMPEWAQENPREFWKAADEFERANGRAYRELEIALPNELTREQNIELVKEYVREHIGEKHPYTFAIHEKDATLAPDQRQPHAHIMFTERKIDGIERDKEHFFKQTAAKGKDPARGGAPKDRTWHDKQTVTHLRESWAQHQNKTLEKYGHEIRVDHRSLKDQGIDREPERHLGPKIAERLAREVRDYTGPAKGEEREQRVEEYYTSKAATDKEVLVYSLREVKQAEAEINKIDRELTATRQDIKLEPKEIRQHVTGKEAAEGLKARRMELKAESAGLAAEKRKLEKVPFMKLEEAKQQGARRFLKGEVERLEDRETAIKKDEKQHSRDKAVFAQAKKPLNPFGSDRKAWEAEKNRLAERDKELKTQKEDLEKQYNKAVEKIRTPEAQAFIKSYADETLAAQEKQRQRIKELDGKLESNRTEHNEILPVEIRLAKYPDEKFEIQGRSDDQHNIMRQKDSLLKQAQVYDHEKHMNKSKGFEKYRGMER